MNRFSVLSKAASDLLDRLNTAWEAEYSVIDYRGAVSIFDVSAGALGELMACGFVVEDMHMCFITTEGMKQAKLMDMLDIELTPGEVNILCDALAYHITSRGKSGDDGFYEDTDSDQEDTPLNRLCHYGFMERGNTTYRSEGIMGYAHISQDGINYLAGKAATYIQEA